jgi:hypothetical protein
MNEHYNMPKNLSEIAALIQRRYRDKFALAQMKKRMGIDIAQQSFQNLMALYQRLRDPIDLPLHVQAEIKQEKKHTVDVLTPLERTFYEKILAKSLVINHATPTAEAIQKSGYFYSSETIARLGISAAKHTPTLYGEHYFVFYSYGFSEKINTVNFLEANDFFVLNLDELSRQEPHRFAKIWTSGHFFAYDTTQYSSPLIVQLNQEQIHIHIHYLLRF